MFAVVIFKQAEEKGLIDKKPKVNAITTAEYATPAKRPVWSVLGKKIEQFISCFATLWRTELLLVLNSSFQSN